MHKKLAILAILLLSATALYALDNTTYLGLSASFADGKTLCGGTVYGELLFEDNWYGLSYQAEALSDFDRHIATLTIHGGLGASLNVVDSRHFALTLMPGISIGVDSSPIFRDASFCIGLWASAIARVPLSQSFSLFAAFNAQWDFYKFGQTGFEPFKIDGKISFGMAYRWDPEESDQQRYVVY